MEGGRACGSSGKGAGLSDPNTFEEEGPAPLLSFPDFVQRKLARLSLEARRALYIAVKAFFSSSFFIISNRRFRIVRSCPVRASIASCSSFRLAAKRSSSSALRLL